MFTSFILVHVEGQPIMINILDISYIKGNEIFLRSESHDYSIQCDEDFEELNDKLCKELNNE